MALPPGHKSKFKNVTGEEDKEKFLDVRVSDKVAEAPGLAASGLYVVAPWNTGGGGVVGCVSLSDVGKRHPDILFCRGHKAAVQDVNFSPFSDTVLSSVGDDCTIKLWKLPSVNVPDSHQEIKELKSIKAHSKKIYYGEWNPQASGIFATASIDGTLKIWDLEYAGKEQISRLVHPDPLCHVRWDLLGNLIATACKDKQLRVFDVRSDDNSAPASIFRAHEGIKANKLCFVGSPTNPAMHLFSTGATTDGMRQWAFWDLRNLSEAVTRGDWDRTAGVVHPFYDPFTQLLYLVGKGDANVRIFEILGTEVYNDFDYRSISPARCFCFGPKRAVDLYRAEMATFYKADTPNSIQRVHFQVPRRNKSVFAEELYTEGCYGIRPALSGKEWREKKPYVANTVRLSPDVEEFSSGFMHQMDSVFLKSLVSENSGLLLPPKSDDSSAERPSGTQVPSTQDGLPVVGSDVGVLTERIKCLSRQIQTLENDVACRDAVIKELNETAAEPVLKKCTECDKEKQRARALESQVTNQETRLARLKQANDDLKKALRTRTQSVSDANDLPASRVVFAPRSNVTDASMSSANPRSSSTEGNKPSRKAALSTDTHTAEDDSSYIPRSLHDQLLAAQVDEVKRLRREVHRLETLTTGGTLQQNKYDTPTIDLSTSSGSPDSAPEFTMLHSLLSEAVVAMKSKAQEIEKEGEVLGADEKAPVSGNVAKVTFGS